MKKIHFIGIKGVGMTPLAIMAQEAGYEVSGCDLPEIFITDNALEKAGITVLNGFSPEHIKTADKVIATGAHGGWENPETKVAKEKGKVLMQGEAVGRFMAGLLTGRSFKGISVAGCHGKTTTTAMIATILQSAGEDPSYIIGTSDVASLPEKLPGHFGRGEYFVAEADEYVNEPRYDRRAKFIFQHPFIAVITNIEFDHPDIYENIEQVKKAYIEFIKNIHKEGWLIGNGDDKNIRELLKEYKGKYITFGFESENDYVVDVNTVELPEKYGLSFTLTSEKYTFDTIFELKTPGEHNMLNASAAIIAAKTAGVETAVIRKALELFTGTKRRLEFKGVTLGNTLVYDDYAHHPTEIQTTLRGLRQKYPHKKIIVVFQPHTFSRTKLLFDQFSSSFSFADSVIVMSIFASAREQLDASVSSEMLASAVNRVEGKAKAQFLPTASLVVQYINANSDMFTNDAIIVLMGAGDVYKIADSIIV